jgi:hypothetical protein
MALIEALFTIRRKSSITAKSIPVAMLRKFLKNEEAPKIYFGENFSI